jgi:hypothetical protein
VRRVRAHACTKRRDEPAPCNLGGQTMNARHTSTRWGTASRASTMARVGDRGPSPARARRRRDA